MLNNIKYLGVLLIAMLLLTNCNKDNKKDDQQTGELTFAPMDANTEKSDPADFDILCDESLVVVYAKVVLNGVTYRPATFMLGDKLYTQSLKLGVDTYTIDEFYLMADPMGTPGVWGDDVPVKATPMAGSDYAGYVTAAIGELDDIVIAPFEKQEVEIDVLCYLPAYYLGFGFVWFDITEITIREQCFFGDFCIKDITQYTNSLYGPDVMIDEKAIFMIKTFHSLDGNTYDPMGDEEYYNFVNGDYIKDVDNNYIPLCIEYADYDVPVDYYKFELWIYVTSGDLWGYKYFHTWDFQDAQMIEDLFGNTDDGVVDFVLGNCVSSPTDLLLPPYLNLPDIVTYSIGSTHGPGTLGGNFDVTLSGMTEDYDIWNGTFPGFCGQNSVYIDLITNYQMSVKSSLYPSTWPIGLDLTPDQSKQLNWLANHFDDYGIDVFDFQGDDWETVQHLIWKVTDNGGLTAEELIIYNAMLAGYSTYKILPGGNAFVIFYNSTVVQLQIFIVDP